MTSEYDKQAEDFLKSTGTTFKAKFIKNAPYFPDDKESRDIYRITLKRGVKKYGFKFGQSINDTGKEPRPYDVFAALQKYDVGTFKDFCGEFGYDVDSRKAEKTYKAVVKEYGNLNRLYTIEELEKMAEIQ